jgi:NAD(P)-dependent dehydrogenase (short-subunit alcohol dehydrogenase family)
MLSQKLQGKVALITGASRGIGAAIAKRYASEGAHVIIVARTISGLETIDDYAKQVGSQATIVPLDLQDFNKIDELGYALSQRFGYIDILVGNAAILGPLSPLGHLKPENFSQVMDVNFMANWRLIRSMDLLLKKSSAGRALFVTSGITQNCTAYWGAYAASKSALETLVKTYANEVINTSIKVNLVDPGIISTNLRAQAMPGEDTEYLTKPEDITEIFVNLASNSCNNHGELIKCY